MAPPRSGVAMRSSSRGHRCAGRTPTWSRTHATATPPQLGHGLDPVHPARHILRAIEPLRGPRRDLSYFCEREIQLSRDGGERRVDADVLPAEERPEHVLLLRAAQRPECRLYVDSRR